MDNSWYSIEVSTWWVFLALLIAAGCSFALYSKQKRPWGRFMNLLMGFLRMSAIFLIILLLINPLLKFNTNETEKPVIVLAIDNSESITLRETGTNPDSVRGWISQVKAELEDQYDLRIEKLKYETSDSVQFSEKKTDLGDLLKRVQRKYSNLNTKAFILATDGIINSGQSPAYIPIKYPVYSIGLGDTIAPRDLSIQQVKSNKIAYQGNQYPVDVKIYQKGFNEESVSVTIRNGSEIIRQKNLKLDQPINEISFLIDADKSGPMRLNISVEERNDESTFLNNARDIYVDVIEGKDRILILAPAPHPDISAIRSVLNESDNYETTVYIPGIHAPPKDKKFDAIIEHQAFSSTKYGNYQADGKWYILGDRSNLTTMTTDLGYLSIKGKRQAKDRVVGHWNDSFSKFQLEDDLLDRFKSYPPLSVPFGDYVTSGPTETMLYQKVGSVNTDRPLLIFFDSGERKSAVLAGNGIWQWRLQEGASFEEAELFGSLVSKTVQYLSIQSSKERFEARVRQTKYTVDQSVYVDTEAYSEVYERTYGNKIALQLVNENKEVSNYELTDDKRNSAINLGKLPAGLYQFEASTKLGSDTYLKKGAFSVEEIQLEAIDLTADHNLLRTISINSDGAFYKFSERNTLIDQLKDQSYKSIIHTYVDKHPLIESIWMMILIILLLSAEWFLRKYLGAY